MRLLLFLNRVLYKSLFNLFINIDFSSVDCHLKEFYEKKLPFKTYRKILIANLNFPNKI